MIRVSLILISLVFVVSACQPSNHTEADQLRKEAELAKKEAELARRELEMSKANNAPSQAPAEELTNIQPTPTPKQQSDLVEKVSLRLIESDEDNHCKPAFEQKIFLASKNDVRYAAYVNRKGYATFNTFKGIKCEQTIQIEATTESLDGANIQVKLPCEKAVFLGTYDVSTGNKVTEKFANSCLK